MDKVYHVKYGHGLLEEYTHDLESVLVVTDPTVWQLYGNQVRAKHVKPFFVESMERSVLDSNVKEVSTMTFDKVIGLGGGVAADGAKIFAEQLSLPLYQIPTAISVNAFICYKTAVRYNSVVKYEGHIIPEVILIDFDVLQKTPKHLNVSGLGDIMSILTASYDWKLNSMVTKSHKFNQEIYDEMQYLISMLAESIDDIKANNEKGIRFIVEAYHQIAEHSYKMRHTMWEDGSEHNFFMNLERITSKPFLHGQVVCLGIYLMSHFQDNQHERAHSMIKRSGIDIRPQALDVSMKDIREALLTLNDFVEAQGIRYSMCNAKKVTTEWVDTILNKYKLDFNLETEGE